MIERPEQVGTKLDIIDIYQSDNVADKLDDEVLKKIGSLCTKEYELDKSSMSTFNAEMKSALDIAKQVMEKKNTPWENAANVKYPLIATSSIQYAARTYPEIVRNGKVVEAAVLGPDPDGQKGERARRVADHMSGQLLVEDPEWESDMDRLLHCLPVLGLVYKKTYWDELNKRNCSVMCLPDEIVVNEKIKSIETARRISHVVPMYLNDIIERIRLEIYSDKVNLDTIVGTVNSDGDEDPLLTCVEMHRFLDLDGDGYSEPYIVTFHPESEQILRIYRRFDIENVHYTKDGKKIFKIDPTHYFTDYHFIPSPDGKFHSIGFGKLLYPINESINALINQMLDSGTLQNANAGLMGKGLKLKKGDNHFKPGEWKVVDNPGDDLRKELVPLPLTPPSAVLFELLGMLVQTGKELSSVSDILQGQQPAQNVPATTVLALIEQGLKVYSSIQKRLYRALKKEFAKLYRLNRIYLDDIYQYNKILATGQITKEDYSDTDISVVPVSDPSMSSDAQRLARAQALMQVLPMVPPNGQMVILRNWLDALQTPENMIEAILAPSETPSPEQQKMQAEIQLQNMEKAKIMMEQELEAMKLQNETDESKARIDLMYSQIKEANARIEKMKADVVTNAVKVDNQHEQAHIKAAIDATNKIEDLKDEKKKENERKAKSK